jgi:hypothetical protein
VEESESDTSSDIPSAPLPSTDTVSSEPKLEVGTGADPSPPVDKTVAVEGNPDVETEPEKAVEPTPAQAATTSSTENADGVEI